MNKGGRPLKFKTPEELEERIQAYFESCFEEEWVDELYRDENGNKEMIGKNYKRVPVKKKVQKEPFTITGLAIALDTDRRTLLNYERRKKFFPTIKKAKTIIENYTEKRLYENNVAGVIFNLKNNYDWKEKQEIEHSGSIIQKIDAEREKRKKLIEQWRNEDNNIGEQVIKASTSDNKQEGQDNDIISV